MEHQYPGMEDSDDEEVEPPLSIATMDNISSITTP